MSGRTRRILLFLLSLVILGAVVFALYSLRGFEGLPLVGGGSFRPKPSETPIEVPTPAPTAEPTPEPTEEPAVLPGTPDGSETGSENVISSMAGALRTAAGDLRYKTEIASASQEGDSDQMSLGHVYARRVLLTVRIFGADGSLLQELPAVELAAENIYQEPRAVDLNGDGSDELVICLHTYENERAVLVYAYDPASAAYARVSIFDGGAVTWSSDLDTATNQIWYRHGTKAISYDCYELHGMELVLVRRLVDDRDQSEQERFSEYTVDGSRLLTLQEKVPAAAIDRTKWSFVNFN